MADAGTLLIIEDEELLGSELEAHFLSDGLEVTRARSLDGARRMLRREIQPDVVLSDMSLPDGNALDLLEEIREGGGAGEWIFLTGYGTVPDSVRALRLGAHDFLEKPCPLGRLDVVVRGALRSALAQRRLREAASRDTLRYGPEAYLGKSREAEAVRSLLRRLARVPLNTLLIGGETGTGKGLAARILHHSGQRSPGPLVEVNCAALPRELMESEIFGHEPGAFSGARSRHRGLFEQAQGGTLFLDEISELDAGLQAKLLKAVEDRRIRRVGGEREIAVDVQLFAASNRKLQTLVQEGGFRADLFHRLGVFTIELPPLRTRVQDLDEMVPAFVEEANAASGKRVKEIPDRVWERLRSYSWPGNVRELRNVIERSVLLAESHVLPSRWLQLSVGEEGTGGRDAARREGVLADPRVPGEDGALRIPLDGGLSLDQMESLIIQTALERNRFNVSAAARALGITRQTLRYRIEKHGIDAR